MRGKHLLSLGLTICIIVCLCMPAFATENTMDNFQKTATYANQFTDVPAEHWAASSVQTCYEYGFMKGVSDTQFSLNGNLTVAEAIVMAARIHEIYTTGKTTLTNGMPWYEPYVTYAVENQIIKAENFTDYGAQITRGQMADIFARALPETQLQPINTVNSLPDVSEQTPYAQEIFALYAAGILTGSDVYGTYHPEANITRAEAAAILTRIALPQMRETITLMKQVVWDEDVVFAVPQGAEEQGLEGDRMLLSEKDRTNTACIKNQNSDYSSLDITVLPKEEVGQIIADSCGLTNVTTEEVNFGDLKAYRLMGYDSEVGPSIDYVVYVYVADDTMTLLLFAAADNDQALKNMVNEVQVFGNTVTQKMH